MGGRGRAGREEEEERETVWVGPSPCSGATDNSLVSPSLHTWSEMLYIEWSYTTRPYLVANSWYQAFSCTIPCAVDIVATPSTPPTWVSKATLPLTRHRLMECWSSLPGVEWSIIPVVSEGLNTRDIRVAWSGGFKPTLL